MRRPAVVFPAVFGAGIFAAYRFCQEALMWLILFTFAVAFFIYMILKEYDRKILSICLAVCFFAAGGIRLIAMDAALLQVHDISGTTCISGTVISAESESGRNSFIIRNDETGVLVNYYGSIDDIRKFPGSCVKVSGRLSLPQQQRNPGCFDYRLYLKSCGIGAVMTADHIEVLNENYMPVIKMSDLFKSYFERILEDHVAPDAHDLLMAMTFGEKNGLDEELYEEFRGTGTAHILAVSGLHVGIVYGLISLAMRKKKGPLFYTGTMLFLILYVAAAGFSPSVVRAAVMIGIHSFAGLLHRRYDLLSAAGTAFIIMLAGNPFKLFSTGFQLSFLAVACMGVMLPYMSSFYKGIFLVPVSVQLGTVPYTAYVFNSLAVMSLAANVPVVILAGILLPAVFILAVAAAVSDAAADLAGLFLEAGCDLMICINRQLYADGKSLLDVAGPPLWMMLIYYGVIFLMMSEKGQLMRLRKLYKEMIIVIAAVVAVSVLLGWMCAGEFRKADVIFVDVGQGDCIHVRTDDGKNYLIDGGGSSGFDTGMKVLKPYLLKNGVKHIDAAFVTHLHEDHYGGIKSLAKDGMIRSVGVYEANCLNERRIIEETGTDIFYLYAGQRVKLAEDVFLDVLAPVKLPVHEYEKIIHNEEDENKSSLIFRLDYHGCSILITGDIDSSGEKLLIDMYGKDLKCDVLKVPHHGSRYSSSEVFVDASDPEIAVFQVGKNNYGHPDRDIIKRYENAGAEIYRNDISGAVGIDIKPAGKNEVITMLD